MAGFFFFFFYVVDKWLVISSYSFFFFVGFCMIEILDLVFLVSMFYIIHALGNDVSH